jgi:hypothetical protein
MRARGRSLSAKYAAKRPDTLTGPKTDPIALAADDLTFGLPSLSATHKASSIAVACSRERQSQLPKRLHALARTRG